MKFAQNLKAARTAAGMTQAELAQKCGMAAITIRQYESGKREPRFEQLQNIASALNVDISVLLLQEPSELSSLLDGVISPEDIAEELGIPVRVVWQAIKEPAQVSREIREKIGVVGAMMAIESAAPENRQTNDALKEISYNLFKLNSTGLQKAVERVSELTEIPKYRRD